jgi:hypothetical protein
VVDASIDERSCVARATEEGLVPHFLISGIGSFASEVDAALRNEGSSSVQAPDILDVPRVCASAGPGSFDGYIQLPATFVILGDTAISRIHHYFADGVLARFPAVAAALPTLKPDGQLTFVMGVLPPEVSTDDDVRARGALVRVLGFAARADGPANLRSSVLGSDSSPSEIALTALGRNPEWDAATSEMSAGAYADWRVELLGMMTAQM